MRRRYKKRRLRWNVALGIAFVLIVLTGIWWSPVTAVRRLRIEGAVPWDESRLRSLAGMLDGVPCARINPAILESRAMGIPEVQSATLTRNPFGSAVLTVVYRQPAARMFGTDNLAISVDGVLFSSPHLSPELPLLQMPKSRPGADATVAETVQMPVLARVALNAQAMSPGASIRVQVGEDARVCLNMGAGRVLLGSCDDMDRKLQVLRTQLAKDPGFLATVQAYDLSNPTTPYILPKP